MAILLEYHQQIERLPPKLDGVEVGWSGGVRGPPSTGSGATAQARVEASGTPCLDLGLPPPVLAPLGRVRAIPDGPGGAGKTPPAP
jgi:hypothetical protein